MCWLCICHAQAHLCNPHCQASLPQKKFLELWFHCNVPLVCVYKVPYCELSLGLMALAMHILHPQVSSRLSFGLLVHHSRLMTMAVGSNVAGRRPPVHLSPIAQPPPSPTQEAPVPPVRVCAGCRPSPAADDPVGQVCSRVYAIYPPARKSARGIVTYQYI